MVAFESTGPVCFIRLERLAIAKCHALMNDVIHENRQYVRRSLKSRVTVVFRASREHLGTLVDVSEQGIGVTSYKPNLAGESYELALLHLPDEQNVPRLVAFDAQCVWCRQISGANYVSGFSLTEISDAARNIFAKL